MSVIGSYNAERCTREGLIPSDFNATDWDDIPAIKAFQRELQVEPDGWIGDVTIRAFRLANNLRHAGLRIDRHTFVASSSRRRVMPVSPVSIVWHDSITRSAKDTFSVLEQRGLSTHFIIPESSDEPIYQCADPCSRWCLHAGAFNQESIGIDVVNVLDPSLLSRLRPSDSARRDRIVERDWSASRLRPAVIDYTESQKVRIVKLAEVLHEFFGIPRVVPYQLTGYGRKLDGVTDAEYRGGIAHGQWSTTRWDGLLAVEQLRGAGWEDWR